MWGVLAAAVDTVHALSMALWILGLPMLFVHRWPRLTRGYAAYAIGFVVVSKVSMWLLQECFLTTIARACWERVPAGSVSHEWFTVRLAYAIFGLTPSHGSVKLVSEALIVVTAAGVLASLWRLRHPAVAVLEQPQRG